MIESNTNKQKNESENDVNVTFEIFFFEIVFQFNDVFEVTFMLYVFELQVGMK